MTRRASVSGVIAAVLVAAAGLLSAYVHRAWQHLDDPVDIEVDESIPAGALESSAPEAWTAPPVAVFSAVTERPLFSPTRRPPPPPPVPQTVAAPPPAAPPGPSTPIEFTLIGVALSDGGRVALVRRQADGKVFRVVEGEEVLGWIARSISRERTVFQRGDREEALELRFTATPPASPGMYPPDLLDMGTGGLPNLPPSPDQGG